MSTQVFNANAVKILKNDLWVWTLCGNKIENRQVNFGWYCTYIKFFCCIIPVGSFGLQGSVPTFLCWWYKSNSFAWDFTTLLKNVKLGYISNFHFEQTTNHYQSYGPVCRGVCTQSDMIHNWWFHFFQSFQSHLVTFIIRWIWVERWYWKLWQKSNNKMFLCCCYVVCFKLN